MDHEEQERNRRTQIGSQIGTQIGTGAPGPSERSASSERVGATERIISTPSAPTIVAAPRATGTGAAPVTAAPIMGTPIMGTIDDAHGLIGQELAGYTIRRKLAEGGMGVVYEGEHKKIGRRGAIKLLKLELCRNEEVVERFYQEARAVNAIRHENIVDIYDFGRDAQGRVFFVMEFLEGEPLSARLRRGALPWSEAFPVLEQTLRALKVAHDKGFVHRDLKPDNLWLRQVDGELQVKLLDFGIAKLVGAESPREKLTRTGAVIGTPHYMSPEQINGSAAVDHRTDLYAMGVITYELFAGTTPFTGDTMQAVLSSHLFTQPPRLADIPVQLGMPGALADIVERMLVKDPAERYDTASDVLDDLRDVQRSQPPTKAEELRRTRPMRPAAYDQRPAELAPATAPSKRRLGRGVALSVAGGLVAATAVIGVTAVATHKSAPPPTAIVSPKPTIIEPPPPPAPPPFPADDVLRKESETTLRASLDQAEPDVRVAGIDTLGARRDQPSIPKLSDLTEHDADQNVRAHAGVALGTIGATDARPLLTRLEHAGPPPLAVWYTKALVPLGDKAAPARLRRAARSKDLDVAFPAGLAVADLSAPGDREAISVLQSLARQKASDPDASLLILTKATALHDAVARKALYAALEDDHEIIRLAAAESLARIGDDAGKQVLQTVFASAGSPNQLAAAVALVALGEYGGLELMIGKLADKDPDVAKLAARGLRDIGERKALAALYTAGHDEHWPIRVAAAAAMLAIVGLDPQVLAQASIDWTRSALASQDNAVRVAAANVLGDVPAKDAVPLLARAFADASPDVRLAASRSAGKIKTRDAAQQVLSAVATEADPRVKEQQVVALGQIGDPVAHDALASISEQPGRIGVLAAGSLIAVGDAAGLSKLEAAITAVKPDLRLAAVEAATTANNPIVVPTLHTGLLDRLFPIRFAAAEGLAQYGADKDAAVQVLHAGLESRDASVIGRALAALARFGERIQSLAQNPSQLLDSPDPRRRLAAVPGVRALPAAERLPLLRRIVADHDPEVRRAGVDAIEDVATKDHDTDQAIRLYRPLANDADPVVRSKAAGQLSRWTPPPPKVAVNAAPPAPPTSPAIDPKLQQRVDLANTAAAEATGAADAVDNVADQLAPLLATPAASDATVQRVKELQAGLTQASAKLDAAATKLDASARDATDTAGATPSPDAAKLLAAAVTQAGQLRDRAAAASKKVAALQTQADAYRKNWTPEVQLVLDLAKAKLDQGDLAGAKPHLDQAARLVRRAGATNPRLDDLYGELYTAMASNAQAPADKRTQLRRAEEVYQRIEKSGTGARAQDATERLKAIRDEIDQLGP